MFAISFATISTSLSISFNILVFLLSSNFSIRKPPGITIGFDKSPDLRVIRLSLIFLFKALSFIQPSEPPVLEDSEILKKIAASSKLFLFTLFTIISYFELILSLSFNSKTNSDKLYSNWYSFFDISFFIFA